MFNNEEKINAYKNLPDKIKEFLNSEYFNSNFKEIGKNLNLLIDKQGILGDEIMLVITGLVSSSELPNRIKQLLKTNDQQSNEIIKQLNEKIFARLKILMQADSEASNNNDVENNQNPLLNKESILSEIENPTPAVHPISIADQTVPGPARPREIITTPRETRVAGMGENKDTVASEFIAGKLTETVSLPSQRVDVAIEKPKKYTADPYREAVN